MAPHIKLAAGGLAPDTNAHSPREKDMKRDVGPVTNPGLESEQEGTIRIRTSIFSSPTSEDYTILTEFNKSVYFILGLL